MFTNFQNYFASKMQNLKVNKQKCKAFKLLKKFIVKFETNLLN